MNRQFGVIKLGNGESPADLAAAGHLARTHRELCLRYVSLRPNTFRCAASVVIHITPSSKFSFNLSFTVSCALGYRTLHSTSFSVCPSVQFDLRPSE